MKQHVRTRFAPSPTGYLHIGAIRTALFAWLLARQHQGEFILRIEDTDKAREVTDATMQIHNSLKWLGLTWDEGPDGGKHEPYVQSERLDIYRRYAKQLIADDKAYADPYSPQELQRFREQAKAEKRPFHFNDHRPANPPDWDGSQPLRLKIDIGHSPDWHDVIRGSQAGSRENIDDFIIIKADGYPTYNFAHIVDDHEMGITHILRGEEFISSMPKFMAMYQALGIEPPAFAHLPQVQGPDKKKLSKRHGALDVLEYQSLGYLPDALVNFLALLGWNDGTEQEFYNRQELLEKFRLERIQSSPAIFDQQRLDWMNGHYIRALSSEELLEQASDFWPASAETADDTYKAEVLNLVQERLKFFSELPELTEFFFTGPQSYPDLLDSTKAEQYIPRVIAALKASDFSESDLEKRLRGLVDELDTRTGDLFRTIRIGVTGQTAAPGLFDTLHVLGKDTVLRRLENVLSKL